MVSRLQLEFPEFITHIPQSKKIWVKIGYNKIHASVHFATRAALVAAMHGYIEKHIPENLTIQGPIETKLIVYAPVNYGAMKMIQNKQTGKRQVEFIRKTSYEFIPVATLKERKLVYELTTLKTNGL